MDSDSSLPQFLRGRSFTLAESDACGVPRRQTTGTGMHTPSRGIRVPWDVAQALPELIRPVLEVTPDGVVSHATAALLWGIPLPPGLAGDFGIHVSREASAKSPRRNGVCGHRTKICPGDIRWLHGLAVTSPLRTWLDLAAVLTLDDLVAAGDFLVCEHERSFGPKRIPLVQLADLRNAVRGEFHRRGIVLAREAATLIRVGVDSAPESFLRLSLERAGIPELTLNYVVKDWNGTDASWPDLALPEWKVAIEYDGRHHLTARQRAIDNARDALMARLGWRQLRITKAMLDNDGDKAAVALVREALRAQGWTRQISR
ncbi:hypothetical protein AL755_00945 (plasmid) [Arthrobacter sp. ERGS1:01]|uniref:endonuclease domain-containing protein n=1 Tax=Arthrobacter sp. ERGS1:01 TaxID=1704044 RepID=UPI0006B5F167|nr:hypothetical protein [Arthrobacter sp. ERGS1:01]ALE04306.1 hypothetical protein AL755_00945 [Arthrobacter sp. ERGS1:01]